MGGIASDTRAGVVRKQKIDDRPRHPDAASLCYFLTLNGYDDWFLPSRDELLEMYLNKDAINNDAITSGGNAFDAGVEFGNYWNSSEWSDSQAYMVSFNSGNYSTDLKNKSKRIRAVRAF